MREAARIGMGISIMSELSIVDDLDAGRLRAIVIDEPLMLSTKAEVITRLGRELPSGVNVILDILAGRLLLAAAASRDASVVSYDCLE